MNASTSLGMTTGNWWKKESAWKGAQRLRELLTTWQFAGKYHLPAKHFTNSLVKRRQSTLLTFLQDVDKAFWQQQWSTMEEVLCRQRYITMEVPHPRKSGGFGMTLAINKLLTHHFTISLIFIYKKADP